MEEEDAFWMLCTIIEDLLPASYYSSTLIGVQVLPAGSLLTFMICVILTLRVVQIVQILIYPFNLFCSHLSRIWIRLSRFIN